MRTCGRICLVVAWVAFWPGLALAQAPARLAADELRALVQQLDADDYAVREEANRKLTEAAEASIDALAAGVGSASPEVAWRSSESLQQIAIQGDETTLNRVVAALDQLSKNGKPGLSTVAQELRAKQVKLRHDRAAGKIRALGGKLAGGGPQVAMDGPFLGGFIGGIDVMPAIAGDLGVLEVVEEVEIEVPPEKPAPLKALDAALKRLTDLLPAAIEEGAAPIVEEGGIPIVPPAEDAPEVAPEPPRPALDPIAAEVPATGEEPAPPPPEAPLAEPEAEGEVPGEPVAVIADAIAVDADFFIGPVFGGGFFIEEGTFEEPAEGLSHSLVLDQAWQGGDNGLALLRDLPSLASLSIADAKLTDAALPHIAALPGLQSLSITNTRFSVAALLKFRKARPNTQIFARGNAMLGIHADTTGSPCILTSIYPDSGAEAAGLQTGDQVVKIDGHEIGDFGDLTIAVYSHEPGDKLQVEFIRGGETKTIAVELKPRAELEAPRR
jgi:hypothetical protein